MKVSRLESEIKLKTKFRKNKENSTKVIQLRARLESLRVVQLVRTQKILILRPSPPTLRIGIDDPSLPLRWVRTN